MKEGARYGGSDQLEVLGWSGTIASNGSRLLRVKCHACATDPELFGAAEYIVPKQSILRATLPCGCSPAVHWTKEQYVVRVNRACQTRGYTFNGFVGDWKFNNTFLDLTCTKHGVRWANTRLYSFLDKGSSCPTCKTERMSDSKSRTTEEYITDFTSTGAFAEGTIFKRVGRKQWEYTCGKCSKDEYVTEGLCSGVFKSDRQRLGKGIKSCRCSHKQNWTHSQAEYDVSKLLVDRPNFEFISWGKKSSSVTNSTIRVWCNVHQEEWETTVWHLNHDMWCSKCNTTGYKDHKTGFLYVLKFEGETPFAGYGISNTPKRRLNDHKNGARKVGCTITESEVFKFDGDIARGIETELKQLFEVVPQSIEGFKTEATHYELYDDLVDFVRNKHLKQDNYEDCGY